MITLSSDIRALFDGPNIAHVATLRADGAPHTVPVWIGLEDEKIVILTSPQSQKARNLSRDPRIAISITDRDQPTAMASIRGRVTDIIRDNPAWEIIDRISRKYVGEPYPRGGDRIVFIIEIDHAFAHTFG
jgi:PPOX class probable F420-dependent enzyme